MKLYFGWFEQGKFIVSEVERLNLEGVRLRNEVTECGLIINRLKAKLEDSERAVEKLIRHIFNELPCAWCPLNEQCTKNEIFSRDTCIPDIKKWAMEDRNNYLSL
jgi:hypothetical protein